MEESSPFPDKALVNAYQRTTYRINQPVFDLRVGRFHPSLDSWLGKQFFQNWIFITAWNPRSRPQNFDENKTANQQLQSLLSNLDLPFFKGHGIAETGGWLPEESFLVPGISAELSLEFMHFFDQNAILKGALGERAQLCWNPMVFEKTFFR